MRNRAFFFGLIILLFSCQNQTSPAGKPENEEFTPTGNLSDLVHNPVRADGTIDSSFLPIISWQDTIFDFGTIKEGETATHDYYFTNTGTAPLYILRASSSCGCTIPEWPKETVPPDSSSYIRVKFNSLDKPGKQTKEVTIFANTFPNQSKVHIKGEVLQSN